MSKNMKIRTQLTIGFTIIELLVIALLYTSYTTAATIITLPTERQKSYLSSYATFSAVLFIVMIIVITGIAVVMIKKITTNLKELQGAAGAMAKGQIDIAVEKKNNDEFGELIDDVGQLVQGIAVQTEVAKQVAEGNLTVEVTPRSDVDVMGIALKQMVVKNRKTLGNIKEAAYQVTTSSSQVASASEALAQGSTEQASAIEEITASIDDVAEKTKQNASQANEAAVMMSKTITEVKKGNEEMEQMVVAMQEINESSENISKIIKVIDDIAFQTNILALNAAVEAARAGDAGKGFAVVAEEVRNLAAKSAAAAAETAEMIEGSIQKVAAGAKIANGTAEALEQISARVQKCEVLVGEIAESSNFQATAIAQIDQAIEQVSMVVQNNSATSEECAAAAQEMAEQAGVVRELVSVYKLDATDDNQMAAQGSYHSNRNEQIIALRGNYKY